MMKIGLQLYSVRDACEKDFSGTIKQVAAMGYQGLEFAGYYGTDAKELRKILDDLGVVAVNAHVSLNNLVNQFDLEAEYANVLGMKTVTVPYLTPDQYRDRDAVRQTWETIAAIAAQCAKRGIQLCYHNHDFEFAKVDNEYILDAFLKNIPELKLELDTFWASFAGVDVADYLKNKAARLQYLHLKDLVKDYQTLLAGKKPDEPHYGLPIYAAVGEGCLDVAAFVNIGSAAGVEWSFVEQDICQGSSLESVGRSLANLKKMGLVK